MEVRKLGVLTTSTDIVYWETVENDKERNNRWNRRKIAPAVLFGALSFLEEGCYNVTSLKSEGFMEERIQRNINKKRRKKKSGLPAVFLFLVLVMAVAGGAIWVVRYSPSNEHGSLDNYFSQQRPDEVSVVLNGSYMEPTAEEAVYGLASGGNVYLEYAFLKSNLDDGYVYDGTEGVLRYATDSQIVTARRDSNEYAIDDATGLAPANVLLEDGNTVYILVDFVKQFTDITAAVKADPNRVILETAGYEKTDAVLRRNAAVRRFGGPKSLILEDGVKGEKVSILEDYGKWVCVLTENGTIGCVMDRQLSDKNATTVEATLPERVYNHKSMSQKVNLVWHQTTNATANGRISELLDQSSGVNVVSPTWFLLADDAGNIKDLSSADYIATCHARGVQVWALVSNLENPVNEVSVLNVTSNRDRLVSNLVNTCVLSGIDGINVDFEGLSIECRNGFLQFLRELSIACEKNDLYLSVDNYPPAEHNMFYNRSEQAKYADYVILMGYDEHNATTEPGSTASLPFIQEAVQATRTEVPAEQLILGLPFYTRLWTVNSEGYSCSAMGMKKTAEYLAENGATVTWLNDVGQNYAEFEKDGATNKIWVEDATSLSEKMKVGQSNAVAGYGFWKLGLETPDVWSVIGQYLN